MVKSTVTSKGQVTIPKQIRIAAMIHEGTQIDFHLQSDGKIIIIPIQNHISQLKGILKTGRKEPVSLQEMEQAISEGAQEAME